jgi:hypothetical protein
MFSLAATPSPEVTRTIPSGPVGSRNVLTTFGNNANVLSFGVPLPPGAIQFSVNKQIDSLGTSPSAGSSGIGTIPLQPGPAMGSGSLKDGAFANHQSSPPNARQSAIPERAPSTSAAQSNWSIRNVPQPKGTLTDNGFNGVTCLSASNCWAVGTYKGDAYQTLIEHWDGTSWTIVDSPNTDVTHDNILNGVTCTSASECWAVGGFPY